MSASVMSKGRGGERERRVGELSSAVVRTVLRDVPRVLMGAGMAAAIAINSVNITGRYVFSAPLAWAEEVMIFILTWCVLLGASAVTYDRAQLTMDLFVSAFTPPLQRIIRWITVLLTVVACLYAATQAATVVRLMHGMQQVSMSAQIPMVIPYTAFVVGFVMIALSAIATLGPAGRTPYRSDNPED